MTAEYQSTRLDNFLRAFISSKRCRAWFALLLLTVAVFAAYANSFRGVFLLDDQESIINNRSIRHWAEMWSPPVGAGVTRRPFLNATFALNYQISGLKPWSYHAVNVLIHLVATFILFGILSTILQKLLGENDDRALVLPFFAAFLWCVNPVQTESVTYISQRAEELAGMFYLLAIFAFLRSRNGLYSMPWKIASVGCCLFGALTKQTIITAPLIICFLDYEEAKHDRINRKASDYIFYIALFTSWALVAYSSMELANRGAGFNQNLNWWQYAFISTRSLLVYLRLALCPYPLIFDYGFQRLPAWPELAFNGLVIWACLLLAVMLFRRHRPTAWLMFFFFLLLAPTTSIFPVGGQPIAENRLYLPLVIVEIFVVFGIYKATRRFYPLILSGIGMCFILLSVQRNQIYASELSVWEDTVSKAPANPRAVSNLGSVLLETAGGEEVARFYFEKALRLDPMYAIANNNLASILLEDQRTLPKAVDLLQRALYSDPNYKDAHVNLGVALSMQGRIADAINHFNAAAAIDPYDGSIYYDRALAYLQSTTSREAAHQDLRKCVALQPDFQPARSKLSALWPQDRLPAVQNPGSPGR